MKLEDLFINFITQQESVNKPNTILRYWCSYNNYIKNYFENYEVEDITYNIAEEFKNYLTKYITRRNELLSPSSISNVITVLGQIYKYAMRKGIVDYNPFEGLSVSKRTRNIRLALTIEEERLLLKYLDIHNSNYHYYYIAYKIALFSGLRLGEVMGLKWKDINLVDNGINVCNNLIQIKDMTTKKYKYVDATTKTKNSLRYVPIPRFLNNQLKKLRSISKSEYVVSNINGFTPTPKYVSHEFKEITKILGFDKFVCFHTLRHTYATRALEAGMNIKTLSELLGHSSVTITLNIYVNISPKFKKQQVDKCIKYIR